MQLHLQRMFLQASRSVHNISTWESFCNRQVLCTQLTSMLLICCNMIARIIALLCCALERNKSRKDSPFGGRCQH
jgi:hypothetical protein